MIGDKTCCAVHFWETESYAALATDQEVFWVLQVQLIPMLEGLVELDGSPQFEKALESFRIMRKELGAEICGDDWNLLV